MPEPQIIRLLTGEEIIARVEEVDEGTVKLTDPFVIRATSEDGMKVSVGLMPFMMFSHDKFFIFNKSAIACFCSVEPQLKENYLRMNSDLILPEEKNILVTK